MEQFKNTPKEARGEMPELQIVPISPGEMERKPDVPEIVRRRALEEMEQEDQKDKERRDEIERKKRLPN